MKLRLPKVAMAAALLPLTLVSPVQAETWAQKALKIQNTIDNGAVLSQTTWVGTHNSFANADDDDYLDVNQGDSIKNQLRAGVRQLGL